MQQSERDRLLTLLDRALTALEWDRADGYLTTLSAEVIRSIKAELQGAQPDPAPQSAASVMSTEMIEDLKRGAESILQRINVITAPAVARQVVNYYNKHLTGLFETAAEPQEQPQEGGAGRWLTIVYKDVAPWEEAEALIRHPKVSIVSWSNAIWERDEARANCRAEEAELWETFKWAMGPNGFVKVTAPSLASLTNDSSEADVQLDPGTLITVLKRVIQAQHAAGGPETN